MNLNSIYILDHNAEYVHIYTEDNIDEGNQGDDENEDFENEDEWEEMEDKRFKKMRRKVKSTG